MIRIYIAAAFESRFGVPKDLREWFQKRQWKVTSSWLDEPSGSCLTVEDRGERAANDLNDLDQADALVVVNPITAPASWGRAFETGYAYACGIPVFVYGDNTSVFHDLDGVVICPTLTDVFARLEELEQNLRDIEHL